jgi:hypothetical protein
MKGTATNLNAPAAALGPNHIPTSFSAALAMRCALNGTTGASRNYNRRRGCVVGVWEGNGGVGVGWRGDSVKRERISISDGYAERREEKRGARITKQRQGATFLYPPMNFPESQPRAHPSSRKKDKSSPIGSKSKEKKTRRRNDKSTPRNVAQQY